MRTFKIVYKVEKNIPDSVNVSSSSASSKVFNQLANIDILILQPVQECVTCSLLVSVEQLFGTVQKIAFAGKISIACQIKARLALIQEGRPVVSSGV